MINMIARLDSFTLISIAVTVAFGVIFAFVFFRYVIQGKGPKYDGLHDDRCDVSPQFPDGLCIGKRHGEKR
jgi:hypothetical protein